MSAGEVESILRPLMTRREQPREIANTVETVYSMPILSSWRESPRCAVDAARMGEIQQRHRDVTVHAWKELSDPYSDQEEILSWAFQPHEFVCVGRTVWKFGTALRDTVVKHASKRQFVVPNPFKSQWGITKAGKRSMKSESQVLERRFTVVEFDLRSFDWLSGFTRAAKLDYQARLHYHLSRDFPLALLVFSGNESAHGWYATKRPMTLMREASSIGADTTLLLCSQFTRVPWGTHSNGTVQRVLYFKRDRFNHG